ncbi:PLP-dependent aminotransferase family protein [Defluviimonas sp. WL0002]|uniref:PLP-dependent aminotransferase family protein n=1 Tax=Albidovulum marisflavi TaxID=2984159 RepID=A0ABT2ZEU0_9RHOB|nr:PLP-dependent aminotransferase family protein [Defluviimonas sp. WL0002]MCV2869653.1 PLP-dependent aminotransferase family protein [Defluviimonas sp. WL0002]
MPIPVETFFLAPDAGGTLQQQIRAMIADGILAGRLRAGDKLPSSRRLADHLGVSRITVTLAYTDLVAGDYLWARGRSGHYVSETAPTRPDVRRLPNAPESAVDWSARIVGDFSGHGIVGRPEDWRSYPYPFIYGQADPALFDHQNWRQCALRALGRRDFDALTEDYYERDDPMLIEYVLRSLLPRRGIAAAPTEVLLTLGAQNALWLATQVLLGPGRQAVTENPCYTGLRSILGQTASNVLAVDVDEEGLPPDAVPAGADVVFVTPSHQSPTNATMPVQRRLALLDRAGRDDFVIVEDDYEFEMSFLRPAAPSLKSLDAEGRVIYVGSFSKSLFPGVRLGYIVAPEAFVREARALRGAVFRHPPGHVQRTVAYFLALGHYDAHLNRLHQAYRRRRVVMNEAIRAAGLTVAGRGDFGGSSFWMAAPEGVDSEDLAQQLKTRGVLIEPGRKFFAPGRDTRNTYRIAYSSIAPGKIPEGIARIAEAIGERADAAR